MLSRPWSLLLSCSESITPILYSLAVLSNSFTNFKKFRTTLQGSSVELLSLITYIMSFTSFTGFLLNKEVNTNYFSLPSNLWTTKVQHIYLTFWSSTFLLDSFALPLTPVYFAFLIPSEVPLTTQFLLLGLCPMELSPELTPSFELYICLQICCEDASFPSLVAFSFWFCCCCCYSSLHVCL